MNTELEWFPIDISKSEEKLFSDAVQFVGCKIEPFSAKIDQDDKIPELILSHIAAVGYWGAAVPKEYGGLGCDGLSLGLLFRAFGRANASIVSLLTVHAMVCSVLARWGSAEQKKRWLPRLAKGELRAAFALSEPQGGSDIINLKTCFEPEKSGYIVEGEKKWISGGQINNLFLIVGKIGDKATAIISEIGDIEGFNRSSTPSLMGFRGAMLGDLQFKKCRLPEAEIIGRIGFGISIISAFALDVGRLCISWSCLGLSEACLEASAAFARQRETFGARLAEHQLIQQMLSEMLREVTSARLVWYHASLARNRNGTTVHESAMAKYTASRSARLISDNALQIFGAQGHAQDSVIHRYWRDAKIMEIIEGSTQLQQIILGEYVTQHF